MIAACYVVITIAIAPLAYGEVQFRISEALTILPFFTPAAIPGLFIGCLIANFVGGAVLPDVIFGSVATLIGAVGTYLIGRHFATTGLRRSRNSFETGNQSDKGHLGALIPLMLGTVPPILANALIIPFVLKYAYAVPLPIPFMMLTVGFGEVISCEVLGTILGSVIQKRFGRTLDKMLV